MDHGGIPHFHNDPGLPKLRIKAREFMCIGASPPFDHPHIYIDMGQDGEAVCGYCSTHFVHDASISGIIEPKDCQFELDTSIL